MTITPPALQQSEEQVRYARWLEVGAGAGLVLLVFAFVATSVGLLDSAVPPQRLPALWTLPLAAYLEQTHASLGWGSLLQLPRGDVAPLIGIAVLAGCSVLSLLAVVPQYLGRGDRTFALLCLAEAGVIVLAASGWLTGGHS
jgi:hypothetical protein